MQNSAYRIFVLENELKFNSLHSPQRHEKQTRKFRERQSRLMESLSDIKLDFRAVERSQSFTLPTAVPEPMR